MEVSNQEEPGGQELIQKLVALTGLPETLVYQELDEILKAGGHDSGSLTLDELRAAMLGYLETLANNISTEAGTTV